MLGPFGLPQPHGQLGVPSLPSGLIRSRRFRSVHVVFQWSSSGCACVHLFHPRRHCRSSEPSSQAMIERCCPSCQCGNVGACTLGSQEVFVHGNVKFSADVAVEACMNFTLAFRIARYRVIDKMGRRVTKIKT